jgi:hypothetical protein
MASPILLLNFPPVMPSIGDHDVPKSYGLTLPSLMNPTLSFGAPITTRLPSADNDIPLPKLELLEGPSISDPNIFQLLMLCYNSSIRLFFMLEVICIDN